MVSPNRRYTCREFLHEVNWKVVSPDSTVGIYIQYIYNKNCGVSFWTCSREISGDRVALFILTRKVLIRLLPYLTCKLISMWGSMWTKMGPVHCFPCCTSVSNVMRSPWHFSTFGFNIRFPRTPLKMKKIYFIRLLPYFTCCWEVNFGMQYISKCLWGLEA